MYILRKLAGLSSLKNNVKKKREKEKENNDLAVDNAFTYMHDLLVQSLSVCNVCSGRQWELLY